MNAPLISQELQKVKTDVCGIESPGQFHQHEWQSKIVTVRCAGHANGVVGAHYFNDEKVKAGVNYQMLDSFVMSGAQNIQKMIFSSSVKLLFALEAPSALPGQTVSKFMN